MTAASTRDRFKCATPTGPSTSLSTTAPWCRASRERTFDPATGRRRPGGTRDLCVRDLRNMRTRKKEKKKEKKRGDNEEREFAPWFALCSHVCSALKHAPGCHGVCSVLSVRNLCPCGDTGTWTGSLFGLHPLPSSIQAPACTCTCILFLT